MNPQKLSLITGPDTIASHPGGESHWGAVYIIKESGRPALVRTGSFQLLVMLLHHKERLFLLAMI